MNADATTETAPLARRAPGATGPALVPGYRIVRELGEGGMGRVYEAVDEKLGRRVALKVLAPHLAASDSAGQRFELEAWIAGRLDHPNVVTVYDRGRAGGVSWFAMQFLDGGTLDGVLQALRATGRDESWGLVFGSRSYVVWAIERILEAARGLDHSHGRGVVHRDVKPGNLLLSREHGSVAVADFGIALDADATRRTESGALLGTVSYMAPEQIRAQREQVGPWTDVYALGATLFELLTLQLPYRATSRVLYVQEVLTGEVQRAHALNARVGSDLETVLRKALEKDPSDRYRSAADFASDLTAVLEFRPIRARRPGLPRRAGKWMRRKPVHAALAAVLAVAVPTVAVLGQRAVAHRRHVRDERAREIWREVRWLEARPGRSAELVDRATALLELEPGDAAALRTRALALGSLGAAAEEASRREALFQRAFADAEAVATLEPRAAWPWWLKETLLARAGRVEEAEEARAEGGRRIGAEPTDLDLGGEAMLAYLAGQHERALELLDRFLARRPSAVDEIYRRGRTHLVLGDREGALVDFRVAVALAPEDPFLAVDLGRALTAAGRTDEAETALRRALALDPRAHQTHEAIADNALERGRRSFAAGDAPAAARAFQEAERAATAAIELSPTSPWAHIDLGAALMERHRLLPAPEPRLVERAVEHYERARALLAAAGDAAGTPAYTAVLVNLCDALTQGGRLARALEVCAEATQRLPDSAAAFYNLAGVHALLGQRAEALDALERDVALGDRDHAYLTQDQWFASLRADPKFVALVERMRH